MGKVAAMALCRLGNQMFIAAAARTFAARTGREFVGLVKTNIERDYPQQEMETVMRRVPWLTREAVSDFWQMPHGEFLCNGFPYTTADNVLLNDFFQDARCIDRDIAFDLFKPYDSILQEIHEVYGDVSDMVCVNVRRGDYLRCQKDGFRVMTKTDIDTMLKEFFPKEKVLFVSEDIEWCKQNFSGDHFTFADRPCRYKVEMDLYLQTQCKANIISNSTFSWWGAYLNERAEKVVCPWPWFSDGKIDPMSYVLPDGWLKF